MKTPGVLAWCRRKGGVIYHPSSGWGIPWYRTKLWNRVAGRYSLQYTHAHSDILHKGLTVTQPTTLLSFLNTTFRSFWKLWNSTVNSICDIAALVNQKRAF